MRRVVVQPAQPFLQTMYSLLHNHHGQTTRQATRGVSARGASSSTPACEASQETPADAQEAASTSSTDVSSDQGIANDSSGSSIDGGSHSAQQSTRARHISLNDPELNLYLRCV